MRRLAVITLVVAGMMLLPTDAHAQGFWRWLEHLSGPEISGFGFDFVLPCRGVPRPTPGVEKEEEKPARWDYSPYCVDFRRDRPWISIGASVYSLAGDNNQTSEPDDRIDLVGVVPFFDWNHPKGFALSAGAGLRRYETGVGPFNKFVTEGAIKLRPQRALRALVAGPSVSVGPALRDDFSELRFGFVYQSGFEAGQFGPGTPALDGDVSFVLVLAFNLAR